MALKVLFRGDSRHPVNDTIFTNGFDKRTPGKAITYRSSNQGRAGDIVPDSAVCVSERWTGAALFPLKFSGEPDPPHGFIYIVVLDTGRLYNTHMRQVTDSLAGVASGLSAASAMWPLYGHELCVDNIPGGDVVGAVECRRAWAGSSFQAGGTYTLGTLFHNPSCTVDGEFKKAALTFVAGELTNHRNGTLPVGTSGYVQSTQT